MQWHFRHIVFVTTLIALLWPLSEGAAQRSKRRASPPAKTRQAPNIAIVTSLVEAAREGRTETIQTVLAQGVDVNARDQQGRVALVAAASEGQPEVVQLLLSKGADANAKDK
jgi:ankyrin repeat protein